MYRALVVVGDLRRRDGGGEPGDGAEAGSGTGGAGYGCTKIPRREVPLIHRPMFWAVAITVVFFGLNFYFW